MKSGGFELDGHHLIICLGPGGVGKTTMSAALAIRAASEGKAVDVMTVDPAPRLLDAMGLDSSAVELQPVSLKGLHVRHGGRLQALKLDPKHTFDALIARHAPSPAVRDAILSDRIYRNLSGALAGVADYMAMEKLLELRRHHQNDLIVLDTPPAREALDFLDAPRRMLELLNSRAATLLSSSGGIMRGLSLIDLAARAVLAAFDRLTGLHLLADVGAFVRSFEEMYSGFAERAADAQSLVRDDGCCVVLVTTAEPERVSQTHQFIKATEALGIKINAIVVNRVMEPLPDRAALRRADLPPALKRKLVRNLDEFAALAEREASSMDILRRDLPAHASLMIAPYMGREPRSLADFASIAASLRSA